MESYTMPSPNTFSDWFWDIIARADKNRDRLESILLPLSTDDLYRFALEFRHASNCACFDAGKYLYLTEDGEEDLGYWIVSQGREFYSYITEHPEAIAAFGEANFETFAFEGTAEDVLAERFGDDIRDDVWNEYERFTDSDSKGVADYWTARQQERQKQE